MNRPSTPWKLPIGLVVLDAIGIITLALGLTLQFAPAASPLAGVVPASAALPMIVVGGGMAAIAIVLLVRSMMAARRR